METAVRAVNEGAAGTLGASRAMEVLQGTAERGHGTLGRKKGTGGLTKGRMEWNRRKCKEVEERVVGEEFFFSAQKIFVSRFLLMTGLKKLASGVD